MNTNRSFSKENAMLKNALLGAAMTVGYAPGQIVSTGSAQCRKLITSEGDEREVFDALQPADFVLFLRVRDDEGDVLLLGREAIPQRRHAENPGFRHAFIVQLPAHYSQEYLRIFDERKFRVEQFQKAAF